MSSNTLAIALIVIFCVSIVALVGAYLYVHHHHRSFRHHSSPAPPICTHDQTPDHCSITDPATKELLYFFYLKPFTPVKPDPPTKNTSGPSPEDQVIDVFKLKEEVEDEVEEEVEVEFEVEVESTPDVDFSMKPDAEDAVVVTVDLDDGNMKTVFSTPCDSPRFFTPVGSPARHS
ncbi:hypothetical protein E3N88_00713 [Mikania micrantha]|uniref:Uncharacterized protein n=1 Tax=Mikania micrantha TaxID=192012 RepID=A0A5N6Q0B0_9ASTR|nr:hypothetical protein E3N88_00713 [Mikania micrantha]